MTVLRQNDRGTVRPPACCLPKHRCPIQARSKAEVQDGLKMQECAEGLSNILRLSNTNQIRKMGRSGESELLDSFKPLKTSH